MPPHESTPLLGSQQNQSDTFNPIKATRWLLLGSWLNVLLIAVPICLVAEYAHWSAVARFVTSFIAIVPLAKVSQGYCCSNPGRLTNTAAPWRCNRAAFYEDGSDHWWPSQCYVRVWGELS